MPAGGGQQFTPWQKMMAYKSQLKKLEQNWLIQQRQVSK